MTDYVAITDTQIEPDAPVTALLMGQLRDNPIAIADGAESAPKASGAAFGPGYWLGFRTGTPATYSAVDLSNTRWLKVEATSGLSQISLSNDGGVTWGAFQGLSAPKYIDLQTGDTITATGAVNTGDFVPLSGCNAVRFNLTDPGGGAFVDLYAIQGRTVW